MAATKATVVLTNGREIVCEHSNGLFMCTEDGCVKVHRVKCDNISTTIAIIPITQLNYVILV